MHESLQQPFGKLRVTKASGVIANSLFFRVRADPSFDKLRIKFRVTARGNMIAVRF